jgi:carbon-monoxide dehydrogenase medium subunit
MKPAPFEYYAPRSLEEALELLDRFGDEAKPLAGGQSLIPAMNFRLATPAVLVDLNRLDVLTGIEEAESGLRVGAMVRHRTLERSDVVARRVPLIAQTMPFVAHAAIRTRGTIGGSLAHADPAAELPAVMLALDARLTLQSRNGSRTVAARDFFTGLFSTALEPGELLTEIEIPKAQAATGYAFQEISRRHGDYALAGAAAVIRTTERGRCTTARVALLSVGDRPILAEHVTRMLGGQIVSAELIRAAAEAAAQHDIDPPGDIHASSRYRRHLAAVLMRRVLASAFQASAV